MKFERQIIVGSLLSGSISSLALLIILWMSGLANLIKLALTIVILVSWLGFAWGLKAKVVFSMRTLSSFLGALREGDYSLRARGSSRGDALGEAILEANEGYGVDLILEMSGSPEAITDAFKAVRNGGRVVLFGIPSNPVEVDIAENMIFKNLTVLATAFAPKDKGGSDEHEPILFTVQYGKGRVFQNAMGHTAEELKSVAFIVPFQRGAEWAATGKVTQEIPDDLPTAERATVRE